MNKARAGAIALMVGAALVSGAARRAGAQGYFGQNQVQYDRFKWSVLETEHFLVHYYPEERTAAVDAGRMAERAYARLTRILDHQFREKKPIVLYASRSDFGQNNVTGDLGEGTGGVTEPLRHRVLLPFTGDYKSFEHVLTHELVHEFQYDIFARGRAGGGLQALSQYFPPLWFAEGMAEYLSLGPGYPITNTIMRDAALNGRLPSIEAMTVRPDRFFPYSYGEALWAYIGGRWGDEVIGEIMNAVPTMGVERAMKRELGLSLEELGDEWKEALQTEHLPVVANLDRPRKFSQALLSERKSGGQIFLAPALSNDGKYVAFLSNGSFLRGEVFIDLWLGDAQTGKRIKRLVKSTTDPNFEELRLLYSQSAFSPDGRYLAFTAQRRGKDVLYLLDVKRRKTVRRIDTPTTLEQVISPTWSPDGKRIAFSGNVGGITDLYVVNVNGAPNLTRLTNDRYGDLQPQWSPDGRRIAFASDRGPDTDFTLLRFNKWQIAVYDLDTHQIEVLPNQAGMNLNPAWAPDGRSLAYVTDRTGTQNLFLYDLDAREHFQLTNVVGGVVAITEYSPVISWARDADRLAYTYYENDEYTVWSIDNPRLLKKQPYRDDPSKRIGGPKVIAQGAPGATVDTASALRVGAVASVGPVGPVVTVDTARTGSFPGMVKDVRQRSVYRQPDVGIRPADELPADAGRANTFTVAQLLDSAALALPDTSSFRDARYRVGFQPEYVARPSVGYAQDNFGRGVFGGTTIVLSDLLGNHQLAFAGQVNGRLSEAQLFTAYTSIGGRLQYSTGAYQEPYYFLSDERFTPLDGQNVYAQEQDISRYIIRQAFGYGIYPLNRFTRFEFGARFSNIDHTILTIARPVDVGTGYALGNFEITGQRNDAGLNYVAPFAAYVSDNTLFGYTGPIMGRRWRLQVEPTAGSFRWIEYLADYRRYDPILFNFLTVATRMMTSITAGRDELRFPKYIGNPYYIRGYDRENFFSAGCTGGGLGAGQQCSARQLLGSRVIVANAELRFPLVRRFDLGLLPISLPPLDGLVFYDAGGAWSKNQAFYLDRPENYDVTTQRYLLRSYGFGLRLNLFGFAILRWDYAKPLNNDGRKAFWTWSLGPSF
ncbi:MAG: hypothetical protein ACJ8AO_02205 [Gemmatimonadaceae bacterium]